MTIEAPSPAADAFVVATAFLGDVPVFALGDGGILLGVGTRQTVHAHDGGVLCAASDGKRLVTGGDDGAVVSVDASGQVARIGEGGAWVDAVACGPDGALAWSAGRMVHVRDGKGGAFAHSMTSTPRGLAFAPKGFQLAIARYGGATLWFPRAAAEPRELEWKGSHVTITWSPDARFVVSTMLEPALHGWRLVDGAHMRMTGYPGKVRSFSWSADGKSLATSGADGAIVWPFSAKDGPMGQQPGEFGVRQERVTRVAFHPRKAVLAIGYEDGMILAVRPLDNDETLLRRPGQGAVSALAWSKRGDRLAFGTEQGGAGVAELKAE